MNPIIYIAWRYTFSKSRQNAINIINAVSSLVLVTGTAALLVVLSAFAGLRGVSLSFVNASDPDIKIQSVMGKTFGITSHQINLLDSMEGVASYSHTLEDRVYLGFRDKSFIAYLKGVDDNYAKVTGIEDNVALGNWHIKDYRCVAGNGVSKALGLGLFDTRHFLKVVISRPGMENITGSAVLPYDQMFFTMAGVYSIDEDFDKKYVFTDISKVRGLFGVDDHTVSSIEILLQPDADEDEVKANLSNVFGDGVTIRNRVEQNVSLYKMLKTEHFIVYAIFVLVLIVALFNLIGSIIMMIIEKKHNMWTLHSMGMRISQLRLVFFSQGIIVTSMSALLGIGLGLLICRGQMTFGWLEIGYGMAYPVDITVVDILVVFVTIIALGTIASWVASSRLNRRLLASL